jgi:hypothetical protein
MMPARSLLLPVKRDGRLLVIGTRGAGATYFVAALYREVVQLGLRISIDRPSREYWEEVVKPLVLAGAPPATTVIESPGGFKFIAYEVEDVRPLLSPVLGVKRVHKILVSDVAGSVCVGEELVPDGAVTALYEWAIQSTGVIWLVDPDPPEDLVGEEGHAGVVETICANLDLVARETGIACPVLIAIGKMDLYPDYWSRGSDGARDLFVDKYGEFSYKLVQNYLRNRPYEFLNLTSFGFLDEEQRVSNSVSEGSRIWSVSDVDGWLPRNAWQAVKQVLKMA